MNAMGMLKKNIKKVFIVLFGIAAVGGIVWLNFAFPTYWLNSDLSSELVLSNYLAKHGGIITPDYFYSTEVRFLNVQLIMSAMFRFFSSWHIVRAMSNIILYVTFLLSYLFLMKQIKVRTGTALLTGFLLFIPYSFDYLHIILIGVFYTPHFILIFVTLGLFLKILSYKGSKYVKRGLVLLYVLIGVAMGIGGIRYLLNVYVPLLLACVFFACRACKYMEDSQAGAGEYDFLYLMALGFLSAGMGYVFNSSVLSKWLSYYDYGSMDLVGSGNLNVLSRMDEMIQALLSILGYTEANAGLFSFTGLCSLLVLAVLFAFVVIIFFCYKTKKSEGIVSKDKFIAVFMVASLICTLGSFLLLNSSITPRYYLPVLAMGIPVLAIYIDRKRRDIKKYLVLGVVALYFAGAGINTYRYAIQTDFNADRADSIRYLNAMDFDFGYASYWNANILTELTNGKIEVANLQPNLHQFLWGTLKDYYELDYSDKACFLLLTRDEIKDKYVETRYLDSKKDYEDEKYIIYKYRDSTELVNDIVYLGMMPMTGCERTTAGFELEPGAGLSGPYMFLREGGYSIEVTCDMDQSLPVLMNITEKFGEDVIQTSMMNHGPNVIKFQVEEDTENLEFVFENLSTSKIGIRDIKLTKTVE